MRQRKEGGGQGSSLLLYLFVAAILFFGLGLVLQSFVVRELHVLNKETLKGSTSNLRSEKAPITNVSVAQPQLELQLLQLQQQLQQQQPLSIISASSSVSPYYRDKIGPVPQVVAAWREAKLDWHELLPKHMSKWERFGDTKGLRLLVSKEEAVADYLTRFAESGMKDAYGTKFGPLLAYSGCNTLL
jgi:hypothetical protein